MHIIPIAALKDNYIWAVVNEDKVIIIDPGEATPVLEFLTQHQFSLSAILITHHHWDHTNGIATLKEHFNIPVWGPLKDPIKHLTHTVVDQDQLTLPHYSGQCRVIEIPGHTLGHVAYLFQDNLFSGDTLFSAGCGRVFEGTHEQFYESLLKLKALPDDTRIYCGHEYTLKNLNFAKEVEPENTDILRHIDKITALSNQKMPSLPSTIQLEKKINPFFRCDLPSVKQQVEKHANCHLPDSLAVFTSLRKWKDQT